MKRRIDLRRAFRLDPYRQWAIVLLLVSLALVLLLGAVGQLVLMAPSITIGQEVGKLPSTGLIANLLVSTISWLLPLATVIACIIFYRRARR